VQDEEPFGHVIDPDAPVDQDALVDSALDDPALDDPALVEPAPASHVPHRYRSSLGASVLAAGMLGLREVLEEPKDDRPVVEQFADEGDRERPVEVDLDPDEPSASVVRLRPDR